MYDLKKRNEAGFTLIETLIVLALICTFILLPTIALKNWQQQLEKNFFYYQFEKSILHLQQVAITDQQGTRIDLDKSQQYILFYTNHTQLPWRQLELPDTIKLESGGSIFFSANKGNISANQNGSGNIPKIVFTDEGQVVYQFQIGSGRFEKK